MKINNFTIILILLILHKYPDILDKATTTILGKLFLLVLITMISLIDILTGILVLFLILLIHNKTPEYVETFDILKTIDTSYKKKQYKEPFVTKSNDLMHLEQNLRNR